MTTTAESIYTSIRFTTFTASKKFEKMPAHIQREMFGKAVFGRKSIRWDDKAQKIETYVTTISRDYDIQRYTLAEVANLVNSGKYAEKGWNGYGYKYGRTAK